MKQAVSYSRFGSSGQAKGSSLERQREMFREWLAKNKDSYYESSLSAQDRGLSAYKKDNLKAGLGEILAAIDEGSLVPGDSLVVEAIDRLSRAAALDALQIITQILNAGIVLITLEDHQTYTKESASSPQLYILVGKIHAANDYSEKPSKRVAAAWQRKRVEAQEGKSPGVIHAYPMWVDRKTKKLNEHEPMIREIVSLDLSGNGLREICFLLSKKYNYSLTDRNIGRWLDNYNAMLVQWNGVNAFEALLTQEEFFEVRDAKKQRTRTPRQPTFHKLSGLLSCSVCGVGFTFRTQSPAATKDAPKDSDAYKRKPKIIYGNCRAYLNNKSCSNNATVPEEVALLVFNMTKDYPLHEIVVGKSLEILNRRVYAGLIEKKHNIDAQYDNIYNLYMRGANLVKYADFERMITLKNESEKLQIEIQIQNQKQTIADNILNQRRKRDFELIGGVQMLHGSFNSSDEDLERATAAELEKLRESPFLTRLELKNSGYRIIVGRKSNDGNSSNQNKITQLTVNLDDFREHAWNIMRRSQKIGCYIVEHNWLEEDQDFPGEDNLSTWIAQSEIIEARRTISS